LTYQQADTKRVNDFFHICYFYLFSDDKGKDLFLEEKIFLLNFI
jgi:hypothetical protein